MLDLLCLNPKTHFKNDWFGQAEVVLASNPSPVKKEEMDFPGLQVNLVYNASSRTARASQRHPVLGRCSEAFYYNTRDTEAGE